MAIKGGKQWITKISDKFKDSLAGRVFGQNKTYNNRSIDEITGRGRTPDGLVNTGDLGKPFKVDPKAVGDGAVFQQNPHRNDVNQTPIDPVYRVEHEPYRWDHNGDSIICISKAHIYEVHPYGVGVKLHELDPLQISCEATCVVYGEFTTNEQGVITSGYTLKTKEGEEVPESVHFILPDEDGSGSNGTYRIPICWIKDGKLERYQWEAGANERQAKLGGTVKGHRGPLWWFQGYDKLNNVGDGCNVFRSYLQEGFDQSDLRTIKDVPTGLSSPYCGDARVRVRYEGEDEENFDKSDSDSIEILGNGYHTVWTIGGYTAGIVEDGLVNCLGNLSCNTLTVAEPTTVSVIKMPTSESDYTAVLTSAGATEITAATGTTSVPGLPDPFDDYVSVISTVSYGSVAGIPAAENKVSVLQSNTQITVAHPTLTAQNTVSVWHTGTTDSAVKTLLATPVAGVPNSETDYTSVVESATYGSVASATAGTTANVLTSQDATVQVADYNLTVDNYTTVLTSGGTTNVAGMPTETHESDFVNTATVASDYVASATASGNIFVTNTNSVSLDFIRVRMVDDQGADSGWGWALGTTSSPSLSSLSVANAASVTSAITSVSTGPAVTAVTYASAITSLPQVTNVVTSTGTTNAVTSIPSKTIGTTTVVATLDSTSAVTSVTQTTVLQNVGTAVNAYTSVSETVTVYDATTVGTTPVVKSLPTTTIGVTDVVQTLPTVSAVTSDDTVIVMKDLSNTETVATGTTAVEVLTSANTVNVLTNYQPATVHQVEEGDQYVKPPSGSTEDQQLKYIVCPESDICYPCSQE